MAIQTEVADGGKEVTIRIDGRFDFSLHREFREAYRSEGVAGAQYKIDLGQTEYIDSAALGMLLMIKEYAEGRGGKVVLLHPSPEARKLLETAQFHTLFAVDD